MFFFQDIGLQDVVPLVRVETPPKGEFFEPPCGERGEHTWISQIKP